MSETTKIQWADATFNPWIGCAKVSPGCKNCYAENTTRARVLRAQGHETWGKGAKRDRTSAATWKNPVKWNKWLTCPKCGRSTEAGNETCGTPDPHTGWCEGELRRRRVFPSLCDWLDEEVPIEWLADFLKLIYDTPNLDWLLLTKRPENFEERVNAAYEFSHGETWQSLWTQGEAPSNVWIGTSCEDQQRADERIPELLKIPAKVRFLSLEPLLGPIDMKYPTFNGADSLDSLTGIHWAIVGGESGSGARDCDAAWIRSIVEQCKAAGVKPFVKQLGQRAMQSNPDLSTDILFPVEDGKPHFEYWPGLKDKKGGDMAEWPTDLRVREFPV